MYLDTIHTPSLLQPFSTSYPATRRRSQNKPHHEPYTTKKPERKQKQEPTFIPPSAAPQKLTPATVQLIQPTINNTLPRSPPPSTTFKYRKRVSSRSREDDSSASSGTRRQQPIHNQAACQNAGGLSFHIYCTRYGKRWCSSNQDTWYAYYSTFERRYRDFYWPPETVRRPYQDMTRIRDQDNQHWA